MADIASLGIVVRSDGVAQAETQLDSLTKTGARAEAQTKKLSPAMDKAAKSAKELQFAARGLPAQFTDIATSLASGQRPLQVLLQQGGQIKDMFGGIGPAARAMGGYIAGLVNPFTLAAAAAGALFIAWKQGRNEAVEFNRALSLTGNFAGTTAQRLQLMSASLADFNTSQHAASAALAEVAATGQFTEQQLRLVTDAAIQMQIATGAAVSDTVKEYVKLGDDPVRAIVALNDKYHFLTAAVYDQIKALQEQGREQDAATLAIETFARVSRERARDAIDDADGITKAWRAVKGGISEAFDSLRNFGRLQSEVGRAGYEIAAARKQLLGIEGRLRKEAADGTASLPRVEAYKLRIDQLKKIIADGQRVLGDDPGLANAARKAAEQRANDAAIALDQEAASFASAVDKLTKKKVEARGRADEAVRLAMAAGNTELVKQIRSDEKTITAALDAQIKKLNEPKKGPKPKAPKADEGLSILARIKQQIALNAEELASQERLTTSDRLRITVMEQLKDARLHTNDATRAAIDVALAELDASGKAVDQMKEQAKLTEDLARLTNQLASAEANRRQGNQNELMALSMGREAFAQAQRRLDIEVWFENEVRALRDRGVAEGSESYRQQEAALRASRDRMLATEEDFQEERAKLLADWRVGARAAVQDFVDESENVAGQMYDIWSGALDGLTDVLTDFFTKGTADWRGFLDGIAAEITRFIIKQQLSKWLKSVMGGGQQQGGGGDGFGAILGALLGGGSSGGGSTSGASGFLSAFGSSYASGGYTGPGGRNQVAGVVHAGEYVLNAATTRRLGRQYLDSVNAGAAPNVVGTSSGATVHQTIQVTGTITPYAARQLQQEAARKQRDITARN